MERLQKRKTETFRGSPRKRMVDFHVSSHIAWLGPGALLLHHLLLMYILSFLFAFNEWIPSDL